MFEKLFRYKYSILFCLILCISTFYSSGKQINLTLVIALISSISLLFLQNILSKLRYTFLFTLILILVISFDFFFAIIYETHITVFILGAIIETDHIEGYEAIYKFKIEILIIVITVSLSTLLSQKELKKELFLSTRVSLLILLVYLGMVIPTVTYIKLKRDEVSQNYILLDPLLTTERMLKTLIPVFYGDLFTFFVLEYKNNQQNLFLNKKREIPEGIIVTNEKKAPDKIYFVIGETARRDHMSLYGYPIKTTPFLDSLYYTKSIDFNFYNGISPAPLTREALRMVLSFASPLDEQPFYTNLNIVELAQNVGYEVYWVSNHDKVSLGDGYVGYISSKSNFTSFRERLNNNDKLEDLNLLKIVLKKYMKNKKQMFFINLIGSHSSYDQRFDSIDIEKMPGNNIVLDYDRSILHTDRVLASLFNFMKADSSAVMIYFSDHGEVIGKGHSMGWKQDYIVPLLMISKEENIKSSNIINKYVDQETNLINTSSIIYIISEVLGYKVSHVLVDKSKNEGKYVLNKFYLPQKFEHIKYYKE